MPFKHLQIERPTARVLGKLRKGGSVRVRSCGSGMCGMGLVVQADRYNPMSKSFNKGKAYTLQLTPEEINANMNPPEEVGDMEGSGLFDSIKKGLDKTFSKKNMREVKKVATNVGNVVGKEVLPVAKDLAKKGVKELGKYAPEIGATLGASALSGLALLAGQPELVPIAGTMGSQLGRAGGKALGGLAEKETNKRIDRFDPYGQQKRNAPPSRRPDTSEYQQVVNTASSPLGMANLSQYLHSLTDEDIETELARRRGGGYSTPFDESGGRQVLSQYASAVGQGLGCGLGGGLYAQGSRGRGLRTKARGAIEKASMGIHGNLLGHGLPPALQSQPYSSNFQMASRMPPQFSQIIRSGKGLYA